MTEHYFSDAPTGPKRRREVAVDLFGRTVAVETANGVFAGDGLDRGTAVVLREVPPPSGMARILSTWLRIGDPVARSAWPWPVPEPPSTPSTSTTARRRSVATTRTDCGVGWQGRDRRPDRCPPRTPVRPALVESADPDRQGGVARAAHRLVVPPADADRGRPSGGGREPRRRHAGRLADRAGLGCTRTATAKGFGVLGAVQIGDRARAMPGRSGQPSETADSTSGQRQSNTLPPRTTPCHRTSEPTTAPTPSASHPSHPTQKERITSAMVSARAPD